MLSVCWWIMFYIWGSQALETTLRIVSENNVTESVEGSDVILTCLVENLQNKPVSWSHDGKDIAIVPFEGNILYLNPGQDRAKYALTRGSSDGGNFTFTIRDLDLRDVGYYSCYATDAVPALHRVDVLKYPDDIIIDVTSQQQLVSASVSLITVPTNLNDWLNLTCFVLNSRPSAAVWWSWNDSASLVGQNLTSQQVITKNNGLYNVSSFLHLSPSLIAYVFDLTGRNTKTTISPLTTASGNVSYQETGSEQARNAPAVDITLSGRRAVNLTCSAAVEQWRGAKSVRVQIGEFPTSKSSLVALHTILFHLSCLLSATSLMALFV